jgi:hypothetical protein
MAQLTSSFRRKSCNERRRRHPPGRAASRCLCTRSMPYQKGWRQRRPSRNQCRRACPNRRRAYPPRGKGRARTRSSKGLCPAASGSEATSSPRPKADGPVRRCGARCRLVPDVRGGLVLGGRRGRLRPCPKRLLRRNRGRHTTSNHVLVLSFTPHLFPRGKRQRKLTVITKSHTADNLWAGGANHRPCSLQGGVQEFRTGKSSTQRCLW